MTDRAGKRQNREAGKRQEIEIERCLAAFGLTPGPRRISRVQNAAAREEAPCRRLRAALESIGPIFSLFGLYLSSRADLLPVSYCLELSTLPDRTPPAPLASICDLIQQSLGCDPSRIFVSLEDEPVESRFMFQSHNAWTCDGKAVTVKVARPGLWDKIDCDVRLLPQLKDAFDATGQTDFRIENAVADFRRMLRLQTDFLQEAAAIEELASDAREFEMLAAPIVCRDLCSASVLTTERLPGISLEEVISSGNGAGTAAAFRGIDLDLDGLATSLCLSWLRQALLGAVFPVVPAPTSIQILPGRQIAFNGGCFARLSPESKANFQGYLIGVLTEDLQKACHCLLKEVQQDAVRGESELHHQFRQIVPFRDGSWGDGSSEDGLGEHLFLQWRVAGASGCRPLPHTIWFYRGLFLIAAAARRLRPGRDSLVQALENLRVLAALAQFQEVISPHQLMGNFDKYAAMMVELPGRLDEALTLLADGTALLKLQVMRAVGPKRRNSDTAVVIALLLAIASVAWLFHRLATSVDASAWVERLGAIVLVFLGVILLRFLSRAQ
ncbi:MAG TPA: AarF/UbiB family protein [Blastocatellia bacterium]|nr:AarF/UbiB family protein [Blastocatellia bacterium]